MDVDSLDDFFVVNQTNCSRDPTIDPSILYELVDTYIQPFFPNFV